MLISFLFTLNCSLSNKLLLLCSPSGRATIAVTLPGPRVASVYAESIEPLAGDFATCGRAVVLATPSAGTNAAPSATRYKLPESFLNLVNPSADGMQEIVFSESVFSLAIGAE